MMRIPPKDECRADPFPPGSTSFVSVAISLAVLACVIPMLRLVPAMHGTTLVSAARWSVAAFGLWGTTWFLDQARVMSIAVEDHLWFASALLAACPAICVLGSRRPGTRVWTWFITIPMLFALAWPVLTLWLQGSEIRGLHLETPQLVGYLLVLIMGCGNYLGTRYSLPALLLASANGLIVLSSSQACPPALSHRPQSRLLATGLAVTAVLMATWQSRRPTAAQHRFDRLWFDFFDEFGIVWGRRIQDRINHVAQQENWPVRLGLNGIVPENGDSTFSLEDPPTSSRIEHAFRWLLRRFVDPAWIDKRLGTDAAPAGSGPIGADS